MYIPYNVNFSGNLPSGTIFSGTSRCGCARASIARVSGIDDPQFELGPGAARVCTTYLLTCKH